MLSLVDIPVGSEEPYLLLLPLGLLLLLAKLFSLLCGRLKMPQVIGYLVAGLVLGLIYFIPGQTVLTEYTRNGLKLFAKVGVILIMFSAGVETDLKKVKTVGVASFFIALCGVVVPMLMAFLAKFIFDKATGAEVNLWSELYYGVILSATSVSITVATLKELGKLDSKVGNALVSAAIIDDIIGIIVLSLVISLGSSTSTLPADPDNIPDMIRTILPSNLQNNIAISIGLIILFMAIFFVLTLLLGKYIRKLFDWLGNKYPHHIRITILSLAFCLIWSYVAELFNIADITGAYLMGLILSSTVAHGYIDHRAETTGNYIFAPVFFGTIAMSLYESNMDFSDPKFLLFLVFGLIWVILGMVGKIIGCSAAALAFKFNFRQSLKIGFGMMARAEVLIVCAQKGVDSGLVDSTIMPFCLILILISSFVTPIMLKMLFRMADKENLSITTAAPAPEAPAENKQIESK